MKVPAVPPQFVDVSSGLEGGRLLTIINALQSTGMQGEYLSWERLRHKTPPGDLSHEEWWLGVKLVRRGALRQIPLLLNQEHKPFSYTLPDELLRKTDQVNRSASGSISISEQVTNPNTRDRYIISSLIEEAITSSQLEGASTSRKVAKEMIQSGRQPKDHSERMIFNNYMAMRTVVEWQDRAISPEMVCELHSIVTDGTLDDPDSAGRIQTDQAERVSIWADGEQRLYVPPPVDQLPDRLRHLCEFANSPPETHDYIPPVLRAVAVHFMMGYDHYFADGNGRTARALFYWSMLRNGYWLAEFLTISTILKKAPAQYARSFLLTEDDEGDLTYFFIYQADVILRAIEGLHAYLARQAEEMKSVQDQLATFAKALNHRQIELLKNALRHPDATYSARGHARMNNVTEQTARTDLQDLQQRGLLAYRTIGRRGAWDPAPDLERKLIRRDHQTNTRPRANQRAAGTSGSTV